MSRRGRKRPTSVLFDWKEKSFFDFHPSEALTKLRDFSSEFTLSEVEGLEMTQAITIKTLLCVPARMRCRAKNFAQLVAREWLDCRYRSL